MRRYFERFMLKEKLVFKYETLFFSFYKILTIFVYLQIQERFIICSIKMRTTQNFVQRMIFQARVNNKNYRDQNSLNVYMINFENHKGQPGTVGNARLACNVSVVGSSPIKEKTPLFP